MIEPLRLKLTYPNAETQGVLQYILKMECVIGANVF